MLKLGSHISFKSPNYLVGAAEESLKNKANTMMIYLGAPQSSRRVDVSLYKLDEYQEKYASIIPAEDIVIHAPYIINPASVDKWGFAKQFLVSEIKRMNYIGAKYIVLHPGAHTTFSRQEAIVTLVNTLKAVLKETKNVEILLETMSGKGTELGTSFEELAFILSKVKSPRLGICLDTCHVWESGFDLRDHNSLMNKLRETELLKKIKVFHINDSKNPIGAHKDRHENLDKGHIGLKALRQIVHEPEFADIIKVLETPWVNGKPIYDQELEMLK